MGANTTAEEKLALALAEIKYLKEQARAEATKNARYPWQNPEAVEEEGDKNYNLAIKADLRLKIKWIMQNKGGVRSIQAFFDQAGNKFAAECLKDLGAN
jgi:hypothetical protein